MRVDPAEGEVLGGHHARDRFECGPARDREPELRAFGTGLDVLVGVRLHARRRPHQHRAGEPDALEPIQLVERVGDDPSDARIARGLDLRIGFVVAVEDQPLSREVGLQRDVQLAARRHIEAQPFIRDETRHRGAEERLARVRNVRRAEVRCVRTTALAQKVLVVREQRGAVLARECFEINLAQPWRQERHVERRVGSRVAHSDYPASWSLASSASSTSRRSITSGALTPSSPSAPASPIPHASVSQRRACVSAASSVITRQSR